MPSVRELSALYENVMLGPRRGPSVCSTCFNFTDGYTRCYACDHGRLVLDAVAPISYSVAREQLHHALASYKRLDGDVARRLGASLAAILWRFLSEHERCLAHAAGTDGFELVTTVPSGDRDRDERHPLRWIVGELVAPTRDRYQRLLRPLGRRGRAARVQPGEVHRHRTDRRPVRASDRRHVDNRRECSERRRGAQGRRRRRDRLNRDRPPPQPRVARERPPHPRDRQTV